LLAPKMATQNQAHIETASAAFSSRFDRDSQGKLASPPAKQFLVVTCMDARLDPAAAFGIAPGDAHVVRNVSAFLARDRVMGWLGVFFCCLFFTVARKSSCPRFGRRVPLTTLVGRRCGGRGAEEYCRVAAVPWHDRGGGCEAHQVRHGGAYERDGTRDIAELVGVSFFSPTLSLGSGEDLQRL
jgi:hypothetical protein